MGRWINQDLQLYVQTCIHVCPSALTNFLLSLTLGVFLVKPKYFGSQEISEWRQKPCTFLKSPFSSHSQNRTFKTKHVFNKHIGSYFTMLLLNYFNFHCDYHYQIAYHQRHLPSHGFALVHVSILTSSKYHNKVTGFLLF